MGVEMTPAEDLRYKALDMALGFRGYSAAEKVVATAAVFEDYIKNGLAKDEGDKAEPGIVFVQNNYSTNPSVGPGGEGLRIGG